jgi:deazaflavin-dependent oxidoreductase (nitroreductase family)
MSSPRAHYIADEAASGKLQVPWKPEVQCRLMTAFATAPPGESHSAGPRPTRLQRWIQRAAASPQITRVLAAMIHPIDRRLLRLSGDRLCLTTISTGLPVRLVTTTGARTGLPRTHPLTTLRNGDRLALIASNFGGSRFPAWYHNLRAQPLARVHLAGRQRRFRARLASAEERARWWAMAVELYPGYADYERRAAPRRIPIFVLEPEAQAEAR